MMDCDECNRLGELGIWEECPSCASEAIRVEMEITSKKVEKIALIVWIIIGLAFVAFFIYTIYFSHATP